MPFWRPAQPPSPSAAARTTPRDLGRALPKAGPARSEPRPSSEPSVWVDLAEKRHSAHRGRGQPRLEDDVQALAQQLGKWNPLLFFVAIFSFAAELASVLRKARDVSREARLLERLQSLVREAGPAGQVAAEAFLTSTSDLPPALLTALRSAGVLPPEGVALPPELKEQLAPVAELAQLLRSEHLDDAQVDTLIRAFQKLQGRYSDAARLALSLLLFNPQTPRRPNLSRASEERLKKLLGMDDPSERLWRVEGVSERPDDGQP